MYGGDNGMRDAIMNPALFFPFSETSYFAIPWGEWYDTRGDSGQRPPAAPREQMELYDRIRATLDRDEQRRLFAQLLAIAREEFYALGTVLPQGNFNVVQNDFGNVPDSFPDASLYPEPGPTRPEQYFVQS